MNSPANGARWRNDNSAVDARSDNIQHHYIKLFYIKSKLRKTVRRGREALRLASSRFSPCPATAEDEDELEDDYDYD